MTFCSKVDHIIDVVFGKQFVSQFAVTNISLDEKATLVVDIVLDGAKIPCVGERVEDNDFDVFVLIFLMPL